MKNNLKLTNLEKAVRILIALTILLWFFPFITKGIDVQDTCSYLTKYRYIFDKDVRVNELFYLFGEIVGGIIFHLMPSHQALALNVASWACYTATAFLIILLLKDYMPLIPLMLCALVGSFFGITWVHCINWNAISMLIQTIGILVLLRGLKRDSNRTLLAAGSIFAVNTFVRLPNILQLALVFVIFWNYFIPEYNFKAAFKKCLWFVLGAVLGAIGSMGIAISILGFDKFIDDIIMLTSVGGGGDSSHGIVRIISLFYRGMLGGAKNWLIFGFIVIVFGIIWTVIEDPINKISDKANKRFLWSGVIAFALWGGFIGSRVDILNIHVFAAFGAIVLGAVGAVYFAKADIMLSNVCLSAVIMEGVLTIGTDTGSAYYRVYMGLPLAVIVCLLLKFAKETVKYKDKKYKTLEEFKSIKRKSRWFIPFGIISLSMMAAFSIGFSFSAGAKYAVTFVYHDSDNKYLVQEVKAEEFAGLKTSQERAELLDRLMVLLEPYSEYKLLQLGSFNAGCVITDMKPFFDSSWPDLEYLTMDRFNSQLKEGLESGDYPVIILADMEQDMSGFWNLDKYETAKALGESELYRVLYSDNWYTIYVPVI